MLQTEVSLPVSVGKRAGQVTPGMDRAQQRMGHRITRVNQQCVNQRGTGTQEYHAFTMRYDADQ